MRKFWGLVLVLGGCSFDPQLLDRTPFDAIDTLECGYYLSTESTTTPAAKSEDKPCYRIRVTDDAFITLERSDACEAKDLGDRCVVVPEQTRVWHWLSFEDDGGTSLLSLESVACSEGC